MQLVWYRQTPVCTHR